MMQILEVVAASRDPWPEALSPEGKELREGLLPALQQTLAAFVGWTSTWEADTCGES